jgi:hypothetical protein
LKIGFTGTQIGMSDRQKEQLRWFLKPGDEFHHGDCIGADAEAHDIAREVGCRIVIHPPLDNKKRAFKQGDKECTPREYLVRNKDIVDDTQTLLVAPKSDIEERRSGTWSTYRYAKQWGGRIEILGR